MHCMHHAITVILTCAIAFAAVSTQAAGRATLIREAVEAAARRSSRTLAETTARESAEQVVETAVRKYGTRAFDAVADGGLELIEAGARYGDDVMRLAVDASPAARRALAVDAGNLVPLVRELGPEALELEAQTPGIARKVFANFGEDAARRIATKVPAEDLPRLVSYAERADTPATRRALIEVYEKEGAGLFERIPAKLVLAGGLTTAMIYGTHRVTAPISALGTQIENNPDLATRTLDWLALIGGTVVVIITTSVLWWAGLFRRRPSAADTPRA